MIVLIIPMISFIIGIAGELYVVRKDIKASNNSKMEHSVQLIDNNITAIETIATQCTSSATIKTAAALQEVSALNMLMYQKSVEFFTDNIYYQKLELLEDAYMYYNRANIIVFMESIYRSHIFRKYMNNWGIEQAEWSEKITNGDITTSRFVRSSLGVLHYIMPINMKNGKNDGMLVFIINNEELKGYFSFTEEYGECVVYITEDNGNLIYSTSNAKDDPGMEWEKRDQNAMETADPDRILYAVSNKTGWKYYVILPENAVAQRWKLLCISAGAIFTIALITGIIISLQQAEKNGKPLDALITIANVESSMIKRPEGLRAIVAGIVDSNKELQEAIENSKPLLRKAFFHDLLTLDVTSSKEMEYLAENAGIDIQSDKFRITSVRLFSNNDFYDVDEQTLQDVKVILQTMQNYIKESISENVWFYQRDYLSLLVIFEDGSLSFVKDAVEKIYQWLIDVFCTESDWGISSECDNLIHIWKYYEEAEIARNHCDNRSHIMEYDHCLENDDSYYFPEVADEKLRNGIKAGDLDSIYDILDILKRENVQNRTLSRGSFIKLNTKITNLLSLFKSNDMRFMDDIMNLNQIVVGTQKEIGEEEKDLYFRELEETLVYLCKQTNQKKKIRRNELIDNILKYVEDNYWDPELGLPRISMTFRISEGYVSALFKEQTTINFISYVEKIRLSKACELLNREGNTIEQIAAKVGYNSVHSFRRAFKRVYGVSPKNYK